MALERPVAFDGSLGLEEARLAGLGVLAAGPELLLAEGPGTELAGPLAGVAGKLGAEAGAALGPGCDGARSGCCVTQPDSSRLAASDSKASEATMRIARNIAATVNRAVSAMSVAFIGGDSRADSSGR